MRQRTPSEIKAYGDGYAEAYKEFCHLLDRHDKDKAIRKMKIFADAVALTVETATDEPQTMVYPQVDGITPSVIEPQTTSTPYKVDTSSICKIEPQTDCAWK